MAKKILFAPGPRSQGVRLGMPNGTGHMLPLEAAERVNQQILEFVESQEGLGLWRLGKFLSELKPSILRCLLDKVKRFWKR